MPSSLSLGLGWVGSLLFLLTQVLSIDSIQRTQCPRSNCLAHPQVLVADHDYWHQPKMWFPSRLQSFKLLSHWLEASSECCFATALRPGFACCLGVVGMQELPTAAALDEPQPPLLQPRSRVTAPLLRPGLPSRIAHASLSQPLPFHRYHLGSVKAASPKEVC